MASIPEIFKGEHAQVVYRTMTVVGLAGATIYFNGHRSDAVSEKEGYLARIAQAGQAVKDEVNALPRATPPADIDSEAYDLYLRDRTDRRIQRDRRVEEQENRMRAALEPQMYAVDAKWWASFTATGVSAFLTGSLLVSYLGIRMGQLSFPSKGSPKAIENKPMDMSKEDAEKLDRIAKDHLQKLQPKKPSILSRWWKPQKPTVPENIIKQIDED